MATTEILSVRLSAETRRILAEAAPTHDAAGASGLARDILERWAAEARTARSRASADRVAAYLEDHPDWEDDPSDFFPAVRRT